MKTKVIKKNREHALHKEFVKILLKSPVKDVKFSKGHISLTFFNHRISDKIKMTHSQNKSS
ncbi:MAG: hypothetical protein ISS82_02095 [Nanoarchaeota archaeon]|nr:hypothetical protein [Nanoarchaeota archaeon]